MLRAGGDAQEHHEADQEEPVGDGPRDEEGAGQLSADQVVQGQPAAAAHPGVGGAGGAACSGDLLLGALAACAQLTCQMVAANMGLDDIGVSVMVEGDLDLRGTLGAPDVPVGFDVIRLRFTLGSAVADDQLERLKLRTERHCVVLQTLLTPPAIEASWDVPS